MGQSIVVLMYGVKRSDLDNGLRVDDDWPWERLPRDQRPDNAYEGDAVGFPIAVSGGADDEEGDLGETCFLSEITTVHSYGIAIAKEKWAAFAKWFKINCKGRLPKAGLLLTTDERA